VKHSIGEQHIPFQLIGPLVDQSIRYAIFLFDQPILLNTVSPQHIELIAARTHHNITDISTIVPFFLQNSADSECASFEVCHMDIEDVQLFCGGGLFEQVDYQFHVCYYFDILLWPWEHLVKQCVGCDIPGVLDGDFVLFDKLCLLVFNAVHEVQTGAHRLAYFYTVLIFGSF
jgi:hypothetical protein